MEQQNKLVKEKNKLTEDKEQASMTAAGLSADDGFDASCVHFKIVPIAAGFQTGILETSTEGSKVKKRKKE